MHVELKADPDSLAPNRFRYVFVALNNLPNGCAVNLGELAGQIGADKLDLIKWARADIGFARLIASKVTT